MDLSLSKEDLAFQSEVRAWIDENFTPEMRIENARARNSYMSKELTVDWMKRLSKKGWLAYTWPKEYGGAGFTAAQKYVFEMEMAAAGTPTVSPFGLRMCAPVIMAFGTKEQKDHYLPRIRTVEDVWCQGYSEPGSGSDLASLRTRAVRDGDHYIVNGQKIWTTTAHWADWIFCLVRTSTEGKPQDGISFLLIDMKTPGIKVEPIITSDVTKAGKHEVNSVFFTDVRVPVANRVGEENKGWTYAKYLLEFERGGSAYSPRLRSSFKKLQVLADAADEGGYLEDPSWREKMAALDIEISSLEMFENKFYADLKTGQNPGPLSSMIKLRGSEVIQKMTEYAVESVGMYAQPFGELRAFNSNVEPVGPDGAETVGPKYFNHRKVTIYGGSSEVQRGIMAKVMLGL